MHKINVIGNSHVWAFTGRDEVRGLWHKDHRPIKTDNEFRVFPIGPVTAWAFSNKHIKTVFELASANNLPEGDKMLFVIGEVDCRWHLPKRIYGDGMDAWDEVTKCVDTYLFGLNMLNKVFDVIAWGVPPPGEGEHDPEFPRWGTRKQRAVICEMFNARMADLSKAMGITYKSIYWEIAQRYKEDFFLDEIHLNSKSLPLAREELGL
jgi:hypothetical protein